LTKRGQDAHPTKFTKTDALGKKAITEMIFGISSKRDNQLRQKNQFLDYRSL
jgi:hypothetical protein